MLLEEWLNFLFFCKVRVKYFKGFKRGRYLEIVKIIVFCFWDRGKRLLFIYGVVRGGEWKY